ncbi:sugar porter (SP) family MFS transporter [Medicago truncatula]|uniref:Sugar porter (SP) family MFS transporter n=1 Tax=Medicago truncatula TaxID=3880 RepID=A0A072UZF5_MEDTR|nr:sugar porter (SP) family MFS transporter [Medicago truncatula]
MAGGGLKADAPEMDVESKITLSVVITCIVAASSGLIFGYDLGISGGVTTMMPFLEKFFPEVLEKAAKAESNTYCVYDSQMLTLFTSSLYLAGLVASLIASRITSTLGRRNTIMLGGIIFLVGSAITGGAQNITMLIIGRILLGFGIGFTNQASPLYLSEIAPPKWRGALGTGFNFFMQVGVVAAGFINFVAAKHPWGWRISLGLAVVPAALITIGALIIYDTPNSLVERGKIDEARKALHEIRGSDNVEPELEELVKQSQYAKSLKQEPFLTILERQYRPHLVIAVAIPLFQQLTGINMVAFYAPNLFVSIGFGHEAALLGNIILGLVNIVSVIVFSTIVDRVGRRVLFIIGGIQMLISQIAVAIVMATATGVHGTGFGWSWGPLLWIIPSEIFPLKIRTTGQSIAISVQFITIFVLSQTFLTMLCHLKYGAFLFHSAWIVVMTLFIILLLPETKGLHLDSIYDIWCKHWYWRYYVKGTLIP